MRDLQCYEKVKIVERNQWVLSRQLDGDAGGMVVDAVRSLGVDVLLGKRLAKVGFESSLSHLPRIKVEVDLHARCLFCRADRNRCAEQSEWGLLRGRRVHGMLHGLLRHRRQVRPPVRPPFFFGLAHVLGLTARQSPRDEVARKAGLQCADGGGVVVGDDLKTSSPDIYAIGECASWQGQFFGLIAPGVEMADVLGVCGPFVHHLPASQSPSSGTWAWLTSSARSPSLQPNPSTLHQPRRFQRPDLSTRLKLMGVEVASFGDFFADRDGPRHLPHSKRAPKTEKQPDTATPPVKALVYKDPFRTSAQSSSLCSAFPLTILP